MSNPEPAAESCPPPLMWQDVRREFLAHSELKQLDSPGGPVSVRVLGSGPPLYLLPGFAAPAELHCLLMWLLRDEFRCVTVEPDWTCRTVHSTSCGMDEYVGMLTAAADSQRDESIAVFGSNFGAAWALAAAHKHPERIARLVLIQGFARRRLSFLERRLAWLCGFSRRTLSSFPRREMVQTLNHRRWFPPFDATRWQYFLDAAGSLPLQELARRAAAVNRFDLRACAGEILTPTMLIQTEGDGRIAEECQKELGKLLPHASTEWLHNTGELAYLTHPHRLAKLMRAFCTDSGGEPAESASDPIPVKASTA